MLNNIKQSLSKLPKPILTGLVIILIWEIILIFRKTSWINLILVIVGAIVGYLIMEIDWFFPKKEIKKLLPFILLPLTIFILTSTSGLLGKSMIIFLNLRLLLDRNILNPNNTTDES
jgi:hypothetical protein